MNPSARIRAIEPQDLAELGELCRLHAEHERLPFSESGQLDRWRRALFSPTPGLYGWVATGATGLGGYMTAVVEFATWPAQYMVYMDCLFVREQERGTGLGRAFVEELASFARARGISSIEWQTPPHNELGIGFYRRIGAQSLHKLRYSLQVTAEPNAAAREGTP